MDIDSSLKWMLAAAIVLYVVIMYVIGWWASRQVHSTEDYLVAGRRLPLSLSWMTILATWFGAGTLLSAADEVRAEGLSAIALDPLGAGVCLWFVAAFVAAPMWRLKLLTVCDFFCNRFGKSAEILSALIIVPSYFGWIAAQFTALAAMLELFFGIPAWIGILLVAVVGTGYTLMGGMWSVTLTDAVQITLVLLGLVVLTVVILVELGGGSLMGGWWRLVEETPPERRQLIPTSTFAALVGWLGVFAIGALGNVPGQDLMQRIFAAKSDRVARRACWIAGTVYLSMGALPIIIALSSDLLFPSSLEQSVLPTLAHAFLSPPVAIIFVVALMSAVLSTIDSAILSPASVMSQNLLRRWSGASPLKLDRICVLLVATCSVLFAFRGERAYALLEEAYALTLVGLFVPLMFGLYTRRRSEWPALASMVTGTVIWLVHFVLGWEVFAEPLPVVGQWQLPISLSATLLAALAYVVCEPPWVMSRRDAATPTGEAPAPNPDQVAASDG